MARSSGRANAPPPPRAQPKSQFRFVPPDTEESEFLDLVGVGGCSMFSGICRRVMLLIHVISRYPSQMAQFTVQVMSCHTYDRVMSLNYVFASRTVYMSHELCI